MIVVRFMKFLVVFGIKCVLKILRFIFPSKLKVDYITKIIPQLKIGPNKGNNIEEIGEEIIETSIKIVQISDLHYDSIPIRITDEFLKRTVDEINKLEPDLIVITGDLVQCNPEPIVKLIERHLSKLKAKNGIYAILGNHDYKTNHGADFIQNTLLNSNVRLLRNEVVYPFGREEGRLQLSGFGDIGRKKYDFKLDNVREELEDVSRPKLILSHNPDSYVLFNDFNYDLILSGHTHGGQICLPNGTPLLPSFDRLFLMLPTWLLSMVHYPSGVVKDWNLASGLKTFGSLPSGGSRQLYINRGLATHPPLRLFCDPEITVITLTNKQ